MLHSQIAAGARGSRGNIEWKRLILASKVVVEACLHLRCIVHLWRFQPAVLSASSHSEGSCVFNNKLHFALAKGSCQCPAKQSIFGERAPNRRYTGYKVDAGGFLSPTIAMTNPSNTLRHVMRSQCVCVCVCVRVFIKLHITAQSGLVILVILCHSH